MSSDTEPYLDKEKLLAECMEIIDRHFRKLHEPETENMAKEGENHIDTGS